jgi:hypothetical protein
MLAKADLAGPFTRQTMAGRFLMAEIEEPVRRLWRKLKFLWRILSRKGARLWRKSCAIQEFGPKTRPEIIEKGMRDYPYEG